MTDDLHVGEIMKWIKTVYCLPEKEILSVFDAGRFLSPGEMGLASTQETESHKKILRQFKATNGLVDTILMPCTEPTHAHAQPCYCVCAQYRDRAHLLFHCDVCKEVPIGSMYACAECDECVYNFCESCNQKYYHDCGKMAKLTKPLMGEEMMQQLRKWQAVRKIREPVNKPVEQATLYDQLCFYFGFLMRSQQ